MNLTLPTSIGLIVGSTAVCAVITGFVRWQKVTRGQFDAITHRSMHSKQVPRGGGLGIALTLALVTLMFAAFGLVGKGALLALGLSFAMAAVGYIDDIVNLPSKTRFGVQIGSAGLAVYALLYLNGSDGRSFDYVGFVIAGFIFATVWFTNLFNFMDGIDGILGLESVLVGSYLCAMFFRLEEPAYAVFAGCLAAANVGFLFWNWPPAKIFMGDVGSTCIGFLIAILSILALQSGASIYALALVSAAFWSDATVTVICRMANKEKFTEAHRSHAFQILAAKTKSHLKVTILYGAINLCWLFPLAFAAEHYPNSGRWLLMIGIVPLLAFVYYNRNGRQGEKVS